MKFTAASFNIGSAHKMHNHYTPENLAAIAEVIKNCPADVICLQEVDRGAERSQKVDMLGYICENSDYKYSFFMKIRDFQGGEYGTAVISKYPIRGSGTYNYPVKLARWGTAAGWVNIVLDESSDRTLTVFNTHLSCENDETNSETLTCYADLLKTYYRGCDRDFIAAGDFNTTPDKIARFVSPFALANAEGLPTYESSAIDNIICSPGIKASSPRTLDTVTNGESDHRMFLCEIELDV